MILEATEWENVVFRNVVNVGWNILEMLKV
jgi:hypothetical protein